MVWSISVQRPFVPVRTNRCQDEFRQGTSSWHLAHFEDHIAQRLVREFLFCKRCLESEKNNLRKVIFVKHTWWNGGRTYWVRIFSVRGARISFSSAPSKSALFTPRRLIEWAVSQTKIWTGFKLSLLSENFSFLYQRYNDIVHCFVKWKTRTDIGLSFFHSLDHLMFAPANSAFEDFNFGCLKPFFIRKEILFIKSPEWTNSSWRLSSTRKEHRRVGDSLQCD